MRKLAFPLALAALLAFVTSGSAADRSGGPAPAPTVATNGGTAPTLVLQVSGTPIGSRR